MTLKEVRAQLPKVGDRLMEDMTILRERRWDAPPEPCTVVYVNYPNLWYRVKFDNYDWYECYKLPKTKPLAWEVKNL